MLRSSSGRKVAGFTLIVAAIAGGAFGLRWFQELAARDPFASYRILPGAGDSVGIRLEDVDLKHYTAARLDAETRMARIDVSRDRQQFDLFSISNGVYHLSDGDLKFAAPRATYDALHKIMSVGSGTRVASKDFDLTTNEFRYDENTSLLTAPGEIKGTLYDGQVSGKNLVLNLPKKEFEVGPVTWQGMLKGPLQEAGQTGAQASTPTKWSVSGDKVKRSGNKDVFTNGSATDGEILVKAPLIERDIKTDTITATGKVYYFSAKANMVCQKAVIFRKEKRAVLTGDVTMLVKPEDKEVLDFTEVEPYRPTVPDEVAATRPAPPATGQAEQEKDLDDEVHSAASRRKYPVVVRADSIEYWYAKGGRHANITGNPQARQELSGGRWRQVWTQTAKYDGEKELLRLLSDPGKQQVHMKTSLGDDLMAAWVELSTKENQDEYEAENVKGDLYPDEEEVKEAKEGGGGGGGGEKPPATGTGGG